MKRKMTLMVLPVILSSIAVTGCEQSQQIPKVSSVAVKKYPQATTLEGTVSNDDGLVKSGRLDATDINGQFISSTIVKEGHYQVEIPANTVLPILLTFVSETGTDNLVAAVIHDSIRKYEINPLTTRIAAAAKAMGGYTHANMIRAAESSAHVPDANKTTTGWRGDPTTQYGGWH